MSIKQSNTLNLKDITALVKDTTPTSHSKSNIIFRKAIASALFALTDITVLFFSITVAIALHKYIGASSIDFAHYLSVIPFAIALFPFSYLLRGLYPGFGTGVVEELRSLTYCTSIVFLLLASATLLVNEPLIYAQPLFITAWLFSLSAVPLGRAFVRKVCGDKRWWGIPVMIIGAGKAGEAIIHALQKHSQIGLRPIIALDDDANRWGYINTIPVVGGLELAPVLGDKLQIDHAIIAMPSVTRERIHQIINQSEQHFSHLTVIPDMFGLSSLWVSVRDLGGILGLEVQQKLLRKSSYITKRALDITLIILLGVLALPLISVISFLIMIEEWRGAIFFRQERMGRGDKRFKVLKFRTMHNDAEQRLEYLLQQDEALRAEYEFYHKLRNDPRVTRIGRLLRKFSFDELPQFWNVLKGDMSLIGPRPYMPREKSKMGGHDDMILKVHPGVSGLWQVTNRESGFEERVHTDIYYIRNWSMFLDIYIIARTIGVVLFGKGGS